MQAITLALTHWPRVFEAIHRIAGAGWPDELTGEPAPDPPDLEHMAGVWIFQSNPDAYDLAGALRKLDEMTWTVRQKAVQIRPGDTAYLWEAGAAGGLLAKSEVLTEPKQMLAEKTDEFVRNASLIGTTEVRVRLRITGRLATPVARSDLRSHPVLKDLPFTRGSQGTNFAVSPAFVDALAQLVAGRLVPMQVSVRVRETRLAPQPAKPARSFEWLESQTLWPRERLEQLCEAILLESPQLILAGPPGTGKTWVARCVAEYLTQSPGQLFRTVQFHPSYGYEEFVEGLRPVANVAGSIMFEAVPGVVLRMVADIGAAQGPHVLLIDEINRANLPKVLGELMFLFEYRDERIDLRHRQGFELPESLRFIGTMNTADRSIRSIDTALRRRFDIIECPPDREILERWYMTRPNANKVGDLLDGFEKLNAELRTEIDRHHAIGHTFFMADPMDKARLRRIWDYKVKPLIEEYFFDQPDIADRYVLAKFWSQV